VNDTALRALADHYAEHGLLARLPLRLPGGGSTTALITRRSLWERAYGTLDRYDLHCSTFGGGAVACAAAM